MNNCLVVCESGNYSMKLAGLLASEGYHSEITSTPCKLASGGCSYSVKFSCGIYDAVKDIAEKNGVKIRAAYEIEPQLLKNNYIPL